MAQKLNIDIVAKDKSKQALQGVRGGLDKVKGAVFNLQNAFIGLGVGLAVRSLVNTGKQIEGLKVRLKFLFGTAKEGAKAFDEMAKFASKVPFSLEEIQAGSGVLAVVSDDAKELAKLMKITGNVAAVTGLDFKTTAEQIQRSMSAGISAADLFRDRGVKDMLGFKAGAVVSIEETAAAFDRVFGKGGEFDGATEALAETFEGTLSMLGDSFFNFKRSILDAGFFDELKIQFKLLDKFVKANEETFKEFAQTIGKGLTSAVQATVEVLKFFKRNMTAIIETIKILIAFKLVAFFYNLALGIKAASIAMLSFNKITKKNLLIGGAAIVILNLRKIIDLIKELTGQEMDAAENAEKMKEIFIESLPPIFEMKTGWQKIKQAVIETIDRLNELNNKSLEELKKKTEDIQLIIIDGINVGIKKTSQALAETIVLGKNLADTFRKMVQGVLVKMVAHFLEATIKLSMQWILQKLNTEEMQKQTKEMEKQKKIKGTMQLMSGNPMGFLGFAASGGTLGKGEPTIVGENGPELFIPNAQGQVTQNARGGTGGGSTTVNFNINTVDARGFDELLTQSRGTITQLINQAVNERGAKSII